MARGGGERSAGRRGSDRDGDGLGVGAGQCDGVGHGRDVWAGPEASAVGVEADDDDLDGARSLECGRHAEAIGLRGIEDVRIRGRHV